MQALALDDPRVSNRAKNVLYMYVAVISAFALEPADEAISSPPVSPDSNTAHRTLQEIPVRDVARELPRRGRSRIDRRDPLALVAEVEAHLFQGEKDIQAAPLARYTFNPPDAPTTTFVPCRRIPQKPRHSTLHREKGILELEQKLAILEQLIT